MSDPRERLKRLLLIVPFVARHPGVTVAALAEEMGVEAKELLEDLELLALVGRPPFSPNDFIDIYVEGDRVYVALDQRFSRPPKLTAAEAAALWASAQLVRPAAHSALDSAQRKLSRALPVEARAMFTRLSERVGAEAAPMDDLLEPLALAARERREVEFDYLAAGRQAGERRAVRPHAVYLHRGQWYLAGFCLRRGGDRLFRVDRISNLAVTERRFDERKEVRADLGAATGEAAILRFTRGAATFAREQFGEVRELPDGGVEVELRGASPHWVVPYVLSLAGEASVVAPDSLRAAVREAAQRAAARYEA